MEASPPPSQSQPQKIQSSIGRRVPPPCWSHEETVALIDSYRDKWYSLRRGNLRAAHWQDVADAVGGLCPHSSPAKTSIQCRHKMEKLRKRYRSELQRSLSSAWVYFNRMNDMEKGPSTGDDDDDDDDVAMENDDLEDRDDLDCDLKRRYGDLDFHGSARNGSAFGEYDESWNPSSNYTARVIRSGLVSEPGSSGGFNSKGKRSKQGDGVSDLGAAVRMLGEGFVKVEKMKMDLMRQIEQARMETEMKRTQMILESQQLLVDAIVKGVSQSVKKAKIGSLQKCSDGK